jgi:hypothetical protein
MAKIFSLFFILIFISSCSMNRFIVGQMTPVFEISLQSFYEETDLELAEQAIGSNLKLLEGLLKNDPENNELLVLLAQGYSGYALGFVEDDDTQRAKVFYERAFNFGRRALLGGGESPWQWNAENNQRMENKIRNAGMDELPALFWMTFAMSGKINVSLDDPAALINVNLVELALGKIESLNPRYFHGSVYLLKGSIQGLTPKMLGGNPEKALQNFDTNLEMTKGDFLLSYVYKAQFYAAKTLDEELFDELILKVENYDVGMRQDIALFNQIAKKKATLLKSRREVLF